MLDIDIEYRKTGELIPWATNARKHSKKQIQQVADSIETFGFTNPVLIDEGGTIIAGHCRVSAAKLLGMKSVPCICIEHMSPAQKRAYVLADNKLALNSSWDFDLLAGEFEALLAIDPEFDIGITGFSSAEVDLTIEQAYPEDTGDPNDDKLPDALAELRDVSLGDVWQLGEHRLVCGDSLDPETVAELMNGHKARMVFTDPPYNVQINGNVCGSGKVKHEEFAFASGEMSSAQFTEFLQKSFVQLIEHSVDGSIHFICMDWRHLSEILSAGQVYTELKNMIVWAKDNGGMGTFYRSRHELIFAFKSGKGPHLNTFELGQHGRYRTYVWEYRGMNSISNDRMKTLALHPTVKPVQMMVDAIKDVSQRGDIVLDLFGGSGSTLIAAEKAGRRAYLCEIDQTYSARIIRRWEDYANDEAVLISNACKNLPSKQET